MQDSDGGTTDDDDNSTSPDNVGICKELLNKPDDRCAPSTAAHEVPMHGRCETSSELARATFGPALGSSGVGDSVGSEGTAGGGSGALDVPASGSGCIGGDGTIARSHESSRNHSRGPLVHAAFHANRESVNYWEKPKKETNKQSARSRHLRERTSYM